MFKTNLEFSTPCSLLQCFILQCSVNFCTFRCKQGEYYGQRQKAQKLTVLFLTKHFGLEVAFLISNLCLSTILSALDINCIMIFCTRSANLD